MAVGPHPCVSWQAPATCVWPRPDYTVPKYLEGTIFSLDATFFIGNFWMARTPEEYEIQNTFGSLPARTIIPAGTKFEVYPLCAASSCGTKSVDDDGGWTVQPDPIYAYEVVEFQSYDLCDNEDYKTCPQERRTIPSTYVNGPDLPGFQAAKLGREPHIELAGGQITTTVEVIDSGFVNGQPNPYRKWWVGTTFWRIREYSSKAFRTYPGSYFGYASPYDDVTFGLYSNSVAHYHSQIKTYDDRCFSSYNPATGKGGVSGGGLGSSSTFTPIGKTSPFPPPPPPPDPRPPSPTPPPAPPPPPPPPPPPDTSSGSYHSTATTWKCAHA